eukprot:scaffold180100_cov59-Cyclotella_meneghiniana.AAC.1
MLFRCRRRSKQRYKRGRIDIADYQPLMNDNTGLLFADAPRSSSRIRVSALRDAEMELERILPGGDEAVESLKKILDKREEVFQHEMDEFVVGKLNDSYELLREEINSTARALRTEFRMSLTTISEDVNGVNDKHEKLVRHLVEQVKAINTSHKEEARIIKDDNNKLRAETIERERHFEEKVKAIKTSHEEELRDLKGRLDTMKERLRAEVVTRQDLEALYSRMEELEDFRKEIDDMDLNIIALNQEHQVGEIKTQTDEIKELTMEKGKFVYQIEQLKTEKEEMRKGFDNLKLENEQLRKRFEEIMCSREEECRNNKREFDE